MREILFRGKNESGKWVEGYYVRADWYLDNQVIHCIFPVDTTLYPRCEHSGYESIIPETIGQCTGLTDKNGTKIFEGDIVERKRSDKTNRYQICYDEDMASFIGLRGIGFTRFVYDSERFEVIGNIYDNPELIEECEQV